MTDPLGQGVAFPLIAGADGRIAWSRGEQNIRESIALILQTDLGERVALSKFGAGLPRMLFEPNNAATHARLAKDIERSLAKWERRIKVEQVEVEGDPRQAETAIASVTYSLVATGQRERIALDVPVGADAQGGV
ncbi:GPW/gp25 family protein [Erythrobacter litoralis]|uniref:Tail lysozyme, putative n=1 Tax=Erythrobacter litoralis (strain HTCC2594) TaxID=314225 RepID=Q2N8N3_ERYLH|nr:GPW/gp25 family protein [Erythrobacter litoralis]ABC63958.1 tail lysozyme, putative [Erythrobacter litoralis HTCC2594]